MKDPETNFAKDSIIEVWKDPESASECNSIKSYEKVGVEAIVKNRNFSSLKHFRYYW